MKKVNRKMENNTVHNTDIIDWEAENNCAFVPKFDMLKSEWCMLFAAFLAAGFYFFAHFPYIHTVRHHLPGIGLTVTHLIIICTFLIASRKKGCLRIKRNLSGVFLLSVSMLISACYGIYSNDALRLMNLPVLVLTTSVSMFSLTGVNPFPPLSAQALLLGLKRLVPSCFKHFLLPLRSARYMTAGKYRQFFSHLLIGLLLGLPIILLALLLLSSADAVFDSVVFMGLESVGHIDFSFILRLLLTFIAALCLFSFLYDATDKPFEITQKKAFKASHITLITILVMLSTVYAVFVYIQFTCLFFGKQTEIQNIGYAVYARSGFFQLVALAVLTLCLIIPFLSLCRGNKPVRVLCSVISVFICVIDYSAFFRMRLYIQAYGMSVLRLITLWGMLMILCALVACIVKCIKPDTRICPALTVIALCTWICLNYSNIDRQITAYQVSAFNRGTISQLDIDYFASLSPDVLPELSAIKDDAVHDKTIDTITEKLSAKYPILYDWSFSWAGYEDQSAKDGDIIKESERSTDER